MEYSSSGTASSFSASQEIPRIIGKAWVHFRVHKSPPLVTVFSHFHQFYALPLFPYNHFNITFMPMNSCYKSRLSFHYLHQKSTCFNLLATDFLFQILAHPVFKMWVIQKPNKVALWNKRHFEGERMEIIQHV